MTNTKDSFRVLARIWGTREGYVFLPWIDGKASTPAQRRRSYHEGRSFEWPDEKQAILAHMEAHIQDDLYFCPNLFDMKRRSSNFAREERALWADLDRVDPREIDPDLQPTIAWESSPRSYQAIWLLTADALLASEAGGLGQRLTYHLGADLGGWDATQLLRPPGWRNHKPEYKDQYGDEGAPGRLLWKGGPRYDPADLVEQLPELVVSYSTEDVIAQEIEQVDRHKVLARVRNQLPVEVKRTMRAKSTGGEDRSAKLFYIEQSLAEVGCSLSEIIALVQGTVWNKFAGRNDELKRLQIEASKAIEKARREAEAKEEEETDFQVITTEDIGSAKNLYDLVENAPRPQWLVQDIWTVGGVGFIDGSPKTFKSFMALDLMLSVSTGIPFLGEFNIRRPGPVLYIQEEDSLPTLKERLGQVGGGKHSRLHPGGQMKIQGGKENGGGKRELQWGPPIKPDIDAWVMKGAVLSDPEWQERLDEQLASKNYTLLVVDPMGMTIGEVDDRNFAEMTEYFYKPLKQISGKYNLAILVIHHTTKSDGQSRRGQRILGSQAGFAWQQDALHLDKKNDKTHKIEVFRESKTAGNMFFQVQVDFALDGTWRPRVLEESEQRTEISGEPRSNGHRQLFGDAKNSSHKALQELGVGRHSINVIAETAGIKITSVRSQLSRLKKEGIIDNDGEGLWWVTQLD